MTTVRLAAVGTAHPALRLPQDEACKRVAALTGERRKVSAIRRRCRIEHRNVAAPADRLATLGSIEARNDIYRAQAPGLAHAAAARALGEADRSQVGCLVSTSCTGYSLPGWGSGLVEDLRLECSVTRLPITEAGCAGGVLALARAMDYVRCHPEQWAIAASVELCSLSFHAEGDEGNLVSSLIFGDGAGAAVLVPGASTGLELIDSASMLVPGTRDLLGFALTDAGFYPVLKRELADTLAAPTRVAVARLLERNGVDQHDVGAWLLHPGGSRILEALSSELSIRREALRWSWESLREHGNMSSAAIFDVLQRYLREPPPPPPFAVVAAFGPGVSIELLLARRTC